MDMILNKIVSDYYYPVMSKATQALALFVIFILLRVLENIGCQIIDHAFMK